MEKPIMNRQLNLLFEENEFVWTGSTFKASGPEVSEFFVINPLKSLDNRKDENVAVYRNFLIEFDNAPLEAQIAALSQIERSGLNIRTAVFSGSKSYHLIFSLADNLSCDYKAAWEALAAEVESITTLIPDGACKNPARLSRLAGATRADKNKVQELVHTGKLITNATINGLIQKHRIETTVNKASKVDMELEMSIEDFERRVRISAKGLNSMINKVQYWAAPAGMHPEILRLTLWAIDSTGVPVSTFIQFAETKLIPHLKAAGYPPEKVYRAINMAYERKGL